MKRVAVLTLLLGFAVLTACNRIRPVEVYHRFEYRSWQRFDILVFEVPVKEAGKSYDVVFFARLTHEFAYKDMGINMIMNTPSGEERIGEYMLKIKSPSGLFLEKFKGDSSESRIVLKRGLYCSKAGVIKLEIENLTPRMQTEGILGAGICLTESGK